MRIDHFKNNCLALLSIIWHFNKMTTSLIRTQQNVPNENLSSVKECDEESRWLDRYLAAK